MIDTTTINFAFSKISEGWQKAAPTLQNVGEKYVRFIVTQQIICTAACALALGVFLFIFFRFKKAAKKWSEADSLNPAHIFTIIIGGLIMIGLIAATIINGYEAAIAVSNPEMYTVQSVIDAARSK
jgi:heme/copper-type cytochrome/quinol oxidase subunit 2